MTDKKQPAKKPVVRKKKAAPRKKAAALPDLEVNSLTVRSLDGRNVLTVGRSNDVVGLWVEGNGQCLGVVAAHGTSPAIVLYEKDHPTAPTIALYLDEKGDPMLQVSPSGKSEDVRRIELAPLLEKLP